VFALSSGHNVPYTWLVAFCGVIVEPWGVVFVGGLDWMTGSRPCATKAMLVFPFSDRVYHSIVWWDRTPLDFKNVDAALDAFQRTNQEPWETFIYSSGDEQPHLTT
jgi:hypothetical protein